MRTDFRRGGPQDAVRHPAWPPWVGGTSIHPTLRSPLLRTLRPHGRGQAPPLLEVSALPPALRNPRRMPPPGAPASWNPARERPHPRRPPLIPRARRPPLARASQNRPLPPSQRPQQAQSPRRESQNPAQEPRNPRRPAGHPQRPPPTPPVRLCDRPVTASHRRRRVRRPRVSTQNPPVRAQNSGAGTQTWRVRRRAPPVWWLRGRVQQWVPRVTPRETRAVAQKAVTVLLPRFFVKGAPPS